MSRLAFSMAQAMYKHGKARMEKTQRGGKKSVRFQIIGKQMRIACLDDC